MDELLLDSTILIDLTLASDAAERFVGAGPESRFLVHPAAEAEVLVGALNRTEIRAINEGLSRFRRVRATSEDFDHCLAFVRRLTLSHGIGWPDCLIAATALRLGLPVATLNDKHFGAIKGLRVVRPY